MRTSQKLVPIFASIAIQLCLGIAYLWSIFQTGIANSIFSGDNAAASLTFSLLLSTLTIGSVLGGKLVVTYSTRRIVVIGGVILSSGFFLASFVTPEAPWLLWLGYGVMGGLGMGFTYSTTIACAQSWFPEKKGFVTGLIVSALGLGGVVFAPIIEHLLIYFGGAEVGEPKTFIVLSLIFLTVCTLGGLFLSSPPQTTGQTAMVTKVDNSLSPGQVLADYRFYLVMFSMMLACVGGLMIIGFAKPIAVAKGLGKTATIGVLVISLFNSVGRLFWGTVSDKLGRKNTILILLIASGALSLAVNNVDGYVIYAIIGCIGFFYGGFLSTFPTLTADLFGPKHMATNYGLVLLGFGAGAIAASYIAGYYKNIAAQDISLMSPAFMIASGCAAVAVFLIILLPSPDKK